MWKFVRDKEKSAVAKLLRPAQNLSLLDAGAGAGFYSLFFKNDFKMNVTAIDSTPEMVEELKNHGVASHLCSLEESAATLSSQIFDRVLAAGVFEFIAHPEASLKALSVLVKSEGMLVLLVPADGIAGKLYDFFHFNVETYIRSREEYCSLAEKTGLKLVGFEKATPMSMVFSFKKI